MVVSDVLFRDRIKVGQRLRATVSVEVRKRDKSQNLFKEDAANLAELGRVGPNFHQRIELLLIQADAGFNIRQLGMYCLVAAGAAAVIGGLVCLVGLGTDRFVALFAAAGAAIPGGSVPYLFVLWKRGRRQEKLMAQLSDAFELMSRLLHTGQSMAKAMNAVAEEFPSPIADEFAVCSEEQNMGLPVTEAMENLAGRTGIVEMKIFATAIAVQRQAGGSLAEMLNNLASIVRDRFKIRAAVQTLTAESRVQAWALLAAAPALMAVFSVIRREYMSELYQYPGYYLLIGMFVSEFLGWLVIRKIIAVEY